MRFGIRTVLCALVAVLMAVDVYAAEDESFNISVFGWNYGRARKTVKASNVVTGMFTIKNITKKDLPAVTASIVYTTGTGEKINKPVSDKIGPLKAGETKKVSLEADFVPAFNGYEITIEFGGKKEEWYGAGDQGQPQPKNGVPVPGVASVLVLGQDVTTEKSGKFGGTVRVKNEGTIEATDVKLTVTFYDTKKKKIGEWSGKLGEGKLAANTEKNVPFTVPNAPRNHGGYELRVGCADTSSEASFSGGEFTTATELEFAYFDFQRPNPKGDELSVTMKVRNGFPDAVEQASITLSFLNGKKKELKSYTYTVPGQLKPGEVKPITFTIPSVPQYDGLDQKIGYKRISATAGTPKPESSNKVAAFKGGNDLEIIFTENAVNDDHSVTFVGAARNGKEQPIQDVAVTLQIRKNGKDLKVEKLLPEVMQHGEERNFVVKVPDAEGFENYSFSFKYGAAK